MDRLFCFLGSPSARFLGKDLAAWRDRRLHGFMGNPIPSRGQLYGVGTISGGCVVEKANVLRRDEPAGASASRGMEDEDEDEHDISGGDSDYRTRRHRKGNTLVWSEISGSRSKRKEDTEFEPVFDWGRNGVCGHWGRGYSLSLDYGSARKRGLESVLE